MQTQCLPILYYSMLLLLYYFWLCFRNLLHYSKEFSAVSYNGFLSDILLLSLIYTDYNNSSNVFVRVIVLSMPMNAYITRFPNLVFVLCISKLYPILPSIPKLKQLQNDLSQIFPSMISFRSPFTFSNFPFYLDKYLLRIFLLKHPKCQNIILQL